MWLVAILAVAAVAVTGPFAMRDAKSDLHTSTSRLLPASAKLAQATELYRTGVAEFAAELELDGSNRVAAGTRLAQINNDEAQAWHSYKQAAVHLPGEKKLQAQLESTNSQLTTQGIKFYASPNPSPTGAATIRALGGDEQRYLSQIQHLYQDRIAVSLASADRQVSATQRDVLIVAVIALLGLMVGFYLVYRVVRRRELAQVAEIRRNDLESALQRALELARTEPDCYTLVQRAVEGISPTLPSELLVADSSRAHFHQVMTTDPAGGPGCPVMAPDECPATNRGRTQSWASSAAIDACPNLRDRDTGPCSAVCVPIGIAGKAVGVVHALGPEHHPPRASTTADLELIARKAGERIGILRAFSRTEAQARTDPLTGLLNRRSLEVAVRDLTAEAHQYSVAYGDLDNFKLLNDVHGHDAGDRALRLFARVLRDSVRPNDIVARYGGEEFVVVLPDCTTPDAYVVIDRVRTRLADAQRGGIVPSFTVSFGLAPAEPDLGFGEIVEQADAALLRAKAEGRDRVVLAGRDDPAVSESFSPPSPPH